MTSSTPIFATDDIVKTLEFYKNVLGFESTWTWGDPPTFGGASSGGVSIMFNLQPDLAKKVAEHQHWIKVEDADASYEEHIRRGAKVVEPAQDRPWGVREYVLEDPNGYRLRFAGPLSNETPRSQPFPDGVRIVRGKPEQGDFQRVTEAAFGHPAAGSDILDQTWHGAIALSPEGEAIGVLRIMHDAPGWYSIWDVAVVPEWQCRRVGSALMKEALAIIQEVSPGAWVFLFTFKHGFYERLGFGKETVSMRKV